ncbi:MAG: 2'-deoxycytidine 5'-triphosphate deaminase [Rhodospirillales bacterium]|nr:2'-deoxycytidine 5'-triphosphate deaminase [Rhodospirillales bacterium]
MTQPAGAISADTAEGAAAQPPHATGILPSQSIRELIRSREIQCPAEIGEAQVQPSSLDLRLGATAYRVNASFLPGPRATVAEKIEAFGMHAIELSAGAVLEKGCVYIVPLQEHVALSSRIYGLANPKSSIGRLDIFTRLITDYTAEFDRVKSGYHGPLYVEVSPRAFSVVVRAGSCLNQLRLRRGSHSYSDSALRRLHDQVRLIDKDLQEQDISTGIPLTIDLPGEPPGQPIGYKARMHTRLIDVDLIGHYAAEDFWEPLLARPREGLILNPGDFYILASKEAVTVPPDHAAEMVAYDTLVGEFRVHYAGFFDPGFGHGESAGTRAVLEVRSHEVPFVLEDGQVVGRLVYERLLDVPDKLYGSGIGSSYQKQGLQLSKHFKPV